MEWTEQFVLRPVKTSDLDSIYYFATKAGTGMTNLPADKAILKEKIQNSIRSFKSNPQKPGNEFYFFVLEHRDNHKIVGCCGIFASVGDERPFYSFHLSHQKVVHNTLEMREDAQFLTLVNDYAGVTEIGSLFILARYRKQRLGEFLSRARYLFMAQNPKRFHHTVIAEMRGYLTRQGRSPFWQGLGKRFIKSNFKQADMLTATHYTQFIGELLPHAPIPVALLEKAAQDCIGKPHDATRAAARLLSVEGFECGHYIDVFDGGPTYEAKTEHIRSISTQRKLMITKIEPQVDGEVYMCANTEGPFRASLGSCLVSDKYLTVSERLAADLHVKIGDTIMLVVF